MYTSRTKDVLPTVADDAYACTCNVIHAGEICIYCYDFSVVFIANTAVKINLKILTSISAFISVAA